MTIDRGRLAGASLLLGSVLCLAGYTAADVVAGTSGTARFTNPLFVPLYTVAMAGNLFLLLGLPVILVAHAKRAFWLTTIGYAGTVLAMAMLNIGEGTIEAFVEPYLATHGGIPAVGPAGFEGWLYVGMAFVLIGLVPLGVAVIRARAFPRWVGALLILSAPFGVVELPGPLFMLGDYLFFIAFAVMGLMIAAGLNARPAVVQKNLAPTPQPSD
ncbi:MAG: hypothetical protein J2P43_04670 [Candidatus Dormibacteraeota bacterium]|nr:hypothetical protein [Candidatus Dormibacteraeota bacterium]